MHPYGRAPLPYMCCDEPGRAGAARDRWHAPGCDDTLQVICSIAHLGLPTLGLLLRTCKWRAISCAALVSTQRDTLRHDLLNPLLWLKQLAESVKRASPQLGMQRNMPQQLLDNGVACFKLGGFTKSLGQCVSWRTYLQDLDPDNADTCGGTKQMDELVAAVRCASLATGSTVGSMPTLCGSITTAAERTARPFDGFQHINHFDRNYAVIDSLGLEEGLLSLDHAFLMMLYEHERHEHQLKHQLIEFISTVYTCIYRMSTRYAEELYCYYADVVKTVKISGVQDIKWFRRWIVKVVFKYLERCHIPRHNLPPLSNTWEQIFGN